MKEKSNEVEKEIELTPPPAESIEMSTITSPVVEPATRIALNKLKKGIEEAKKCKEQES